jgi:hypothetical protein
MVGGAVKAGSGRVGGLSVQLLAVFLTYTAIVSSYAPIMIKEFRRLAEEQQAGSGIRTEPVGDGTVVTAAPGDGVEARAFLTALGNALESWTSDSVVVGPEQERQLDATYGSLKSLLAVDGSPRFRFGDSGVSYAGQPVAELGAWPWSARLASAGYGAVTFESTATRLDLLRMMDAVREAGPLEDQPSGPLQVTFALAFMVALLYLAPILAGFQNIIGIAIIGFALWEAWRINRRPSVEIKGPFEVKPAVAGSAG